MNRKIAPPIKDAVEYALALKPYDHFELDNGIPVYTVHAGAQEVVQIEMIFYAGNYFEQQKGVAAATNFLLKNGTSKRNAFQLNEAFDYYGAYCNRSCYNETAVLSLHTLTKHLHHLLPVMEEMITDSIFSAAELEIYQQNVIQRLRVNLQKAEFVAGRLIDAYVYGSNHPYGVYSQIEDIERLTAEACQAFYRNYYLQGKCILFVSGNLPSDIRQQLNRHFGTLSARQHSLAIQPITTQPAVEKKILHSKRSESCSRCHPNSSAFSQ